MSRAGREMILFKSSAEKLTPEQQRVIRAHWEWSGRYAMLWIIVTILIFAGVSFVLDYVGADDSGSCAYRQNALSRSACNTHFGQRGVEGCGYGASTNLKGFSDSLSSPTTGYFFTEISFAAMIASLDELMIMARRDYDKPS
jgi:hypothetical protein